MHMKFSDRFSCLRAGRTRRDVIFTFTCVRYTLRLQAFRKYDVAGTELCTIWQDRDDEYLHTVLNLHNTHRHTVVMFDNSNSNVI